MLHACRAPHLTPLTAASIVVAAALWPPATAHGQSAPPAPAVTPAPAGDAALDGVVTDSAGRPLRNALLAADSLGRAV